MRLALFASKFEDFFRGGVSVLVLLLAPLILGGTNPRCVEWGDGVSAVAYRFEEDRSDVALLRPVEPGAEQVVWHGDSMSRLVFYNWNESGGEATMSAGDSASFASAATWSGPMITADRPWLILLGNPERQQFGPPLPCVSQAMDGGAVGSGLACRPWQRVRSVDLGVCSLELPYERRGPPLTYPSAFMNSIGLDRVALGDELLEGLLERMDTRQGVWRHGVFVPVRTTADPASSWWYRSSVNDEICLRIGYTLKHGAPRGLGLLPVGGRCRNRPAAATICGAIALNENGDATWYTSHLENALTESHGGCIDSVVSGVTDAIADEVAHDDDDDGSGNAISEALREQLGARLSVDTSIFRDLWSDSDQDEAEFAAPTSCDAPEPGRGREAPDCFNGVLRNLRGQGRCVSADGDEPGLGRCRYQVPLRRIERTPTGVDLILVDHDDLGNSAWGVWLFLGVARSGPYYSVARELDRSHCAAPSEDDPRNITRVSRQHERFLRRPQTHRVSE